jgi:hypothetical protein
MLLSHGAKARSILLLLVNKFWQQQVMKVQPPVVPFSLVACSLFVYYASLLSWLAAAYQQLLLAASQLIIISQQGSI